MTDLSKQKKRLKASIQIPLGERIFYLADDALMIFLCVLILVPLIHVVAGSFSDGMSYMTHSGLLLWPLSPTRDAYRSVIHNQNIWTGYGNTLFIVIVGTVLDMLCSLVAAYVLSRKNYMLKKFFNLMVVFSMYFSGGMIPAYLNIRDLGLYNSLWALILPGAMSVYNSIICRTAIQAVPDSLTESAYIDGANDVVIVFRIILPLIMPTIAVLLLYYGVGHWNSWFNASIYMKDNDKLPIQNIMRAILIANSSVLNSAAAENDQVNEFAESIKYSTIILTTVPVLCIYPFLQKYVVKGVMVGAVKG